MRTGPRKKKNFVFSRLNVLFFIVFALFSILILRLGFVQIVEGETHLKSLERTSNATARIDAPRGLMYDRFGYVLVDNELELSLTYTSQSQTRDTEEMLDVARKLEQLIEVDTSKITERDRKDYWLLQASREERLELVSLEERKEIDDPQEEYALELERITDEHLNSLTEEDERILAIFRQMNQGYALTPQRIKRDISEEEAHSIAEKLDELPGVDILRDSRRKYPYGNSLRSVFGNTGSIPREQLNNYLAKGYERSDIVGTSYLELQYEDVLRGQKAVVESMTTSSAGDMIEQTINEQLGSRGNDLVLAIDMEMQQYLDDIVERRISQNPGAFINEGSAYVVMMDPKTGDILAMTGYSTNQENDHIGVVNKAFEMGSSIKGASVLTGFQTGVASPGTVFYDRPIDLPGTPIKKSVRNYGAVSSQRALEVSSNVYMFEIAMRMAGYNYNSKCCWNSETIERAYNEARYYFSQFGLGTETGIDLPSEYTGVNGGVQQAGNLLDLMIGQFDTYTTMQLAQYISTIANDGYRMQPRLVTEIREPSADKDSRGAVVQQFEPRVLNRIDMTDAQIRDVQQGFRRVSTNGTASRFFANKTYTTATKTGTAQVRVAVGEGENRRFIDGNNQALVGYAPYDDPEVAFAIIVPYAKRDSAPGANADLARDIGAEMLDTYFELKERREGPTLADDPVLEDFEGND
ncbi:penicillin-binding protein 2 [Halalkalibacterium halodurans]|uniref:peptidoglycan D,D-transpeptidase FtsI family protein n=1 Tax=Halalkalibacterium halodurans TaxID=86665 RepID=UPI0010688701|nr:penicillin-binding protein 2 [Halalkalibacterium halodurans]TES56704.1 penicillin-binding protein 2 [Halalkalibacterium halodurans]